MAEVALTAISVGRTVDGKFERVEVKAGDSLPAWVTKEDKEALRANGALGEPVPTQEDIDSKDAEIERLKALLAEAQAKGADSAKESNDAPKDTNAPKDK